MRRRHSTDTGDATRQGGSPRPWIAGLVIVLVGAAPAMSRAGATAPEPSVPGARVVPVEEAEGTEGTATRVVVRVVSRGAKVIGSSVGGARVWVRDPGSGRVLAEGVQRGSTGDTGAIMREPRRTGEAVYSTAPSAHVELSLDLDRPRRLEVVAEAPSGMPEAAQRIARTVWLIPGVDLAGEGIVLELAGLIVSIDEPSYRVAVAADEELEIRARVTMLCGCPITAGGLWDADATRVWAEVRQDDALRATVPLRYGGEANLFRAVRPAGELGLEPGPFEVVVGAVRPEEDNTGVDRTVAVFLE